MHDVVAPGIGAIPNPRAILQLQRDAGNARTAVLVSGTQRYLQRQRSGRPRYTNYRAPRAQQRLIEQLLAPNSPLYERLNPHGESEFNCPATAGAVDHFLATGQVQPAEAGDATHTFRYRLGPMTAARDVGEIRAVLTNPNSHATVQGLRDEATRQRLRVTEDHMFHVVNHRGQIIVIEAFGPQGTPRVHRNLERYISEQGFSSLRYYRGEFRVERAGGLEGLETDDPIAAAAAAR